MKIKGEDLFTLAFWLTMIMIIIVFIANAECKWEKIDKLTDGLVVNIFTYQDGLFIGCGSGVIIDENVCVTSNHVIRFGNTFKVMFQGEVYTATFLDSSGAMDGIAFLKIDNFFCSNPAQFAKPQLHTQIMIKANAMNIPNIIIYGNVSMRRNIFGYNHKIWFIDRGIAPGMSGGGVWNKDGKLVGILFGIFNLRWTFMGLFTSSRNVEKQYLLYKTRKGLK